MDSEETVQVMHTLPRRLRLRVPPLVGQRGASERVARTLAREGGYARVTVRPSTGSVILEGDENTISPDLVIARLRELVAAETTDLGAPLLSPPPEPPGPTRIARAVTHAALGINDDIRLALDNRADLGTLMPVVFATAGLADVISTGRLPMPSWFNLLWWSMRSFMTFNLAAMEEEARAHRRDER